MDQKIVNILSVNAGSSSIKLDLFSANPARSGLERTLELSITGIGQPAAVLSVHKLPGSRQTSQLKATDHAAAIDLLIKCLGENVPADSLAAIGHRVVHGGPRHSQPEIITEELEHELQDYTSFDPEHAPAALQLIRAMRQQFPKVPQAACFDTAFFHDLPRVAQLLPLPRKYEDIGLRRYGFHGLSYTYLQSALQAKAGDKANGRVIYAHLGSGASLAATRSGKPVDTTMSFTPASGIIMSSRTGDLDPGIFGYLHQQTGLSVEEYTRMVNYESGLLGVSGISADMYTLLQNEASDSRAADAVNLFVYQVKKSIGGLAAAIGGLDSLVFSGGIGEQSPIIRERIVEGLGFLGAELDKSCNDQQAQLISTPASRVGVYVIAADEASIIAQQAIETISPKTVAGGSQ